MVHKNNRLLKIGLPFSNVNQPVTLIYVCNPPEKKRCQRKKLLYNTSARHLPTTELEIQLFVYCELFMGISLAVLKSHRIIR